MSELADMQKEITAKISYPDKAENLLFPLSALCGAVGDLVERVEPFIDKGVVPEQFKLDVWAFAVAASKMSDWAKKIQSKPDAVPKGVVRGDLGDIGNQSRKELAECLAMLSEVAGRMKVNVKEVAAIAAKKKEV